MAAQLDEAKRGNKEAILVEKLGSTESKVQELDAERNRLAAELGEAGKRNEVRENAIWQVYDLPGLRPLARG